MLPDTSKQTLAFQLGSPVALAVPRRTSAAALRLKRALLSLFLLFTCLFIVVRLLIVPHDAFSTVSEY